MGLDFESVNSENIQIADADALDILNDFTIMSWVKGENTVNGAIFVKTGTEYNFKTTAVGIMGFNIVIYNTGFQSQNQDFGERIQDTNIHHVALRWNQTTGKVDFFVDGIPGTQYTLTTGSMAGSADPAYIAFDGGSNYYDGLLWDVRLYSAALSDEMISTIYHSQGKDNFAYDLNGRWLMQEGGNGDSASGAGSILDLTKFRNHGDPVNTPIYAAVPLRLF